MKKYVIGIDYGTLAARCILVDAENGKEISESVMNYPHGVIDEKLPCGEKLPPNYALQNPKDYIDVLSFTVRDTLKKAGVSAEDVVGIGVDFTACTLLPIDENGNPLCMKKEYENEKHAYVKLWKHHAAQDEADAITTLAQKRGEAWLSNYGGRISSEWMLPKILEVLRECPDIYEKTYRFTEAADWLSLMLTGKETHSAVFAGYKGLWSAKYGYPSNEFLKGLDSRLDGIVGSKISTEVLTMDKNAGYLNARGASITGLKEGTPVALPMIDAHAAMPALNIVDKGDLMLIIGTSSCHILNAGEEKEVDGICGFVKDGVIPGLCTYEAGQAGVGDIFDWFVKNSIPQQYADEAKEKGIGLHKLLREKAKAQKPGESGLIALDWWNGNRSILGDSNLSGMLVGMTLQTKPEDIYRALIEATAYGLRIIVNQYEKCEIEIKNIVAAGGIAQKDEMLMQIYSDVLNREISVAGTSQAGALGSAIYAAVASGVYKSVKDAAAKLSKPHAKVYKPNPENAKIYDTLYSEYKTLHDYFGKENSVMKKLQKMK